MSPLPRCAADLTWIAGARPLMRSEFWRDGGFDIAGPLPDASSHAAELVATLPTLGPRPKVGRYFERLHELALAHSDGFEALASQLPLRDGGRTLGELDCLYRSGDRVVHREVAVKYYLCVEDSSDPRCWWGPSKRDRLHLKLERMQTHQLRLSELAGDAWPRGLPRPHRREALLLGALFRREEHRQLPEGANPKLELGRWFYASEFEPEGWRSLPKPWWLSPLQLRWEPPAPPDPQAIHHPLLVAREGSDGVERAFVVPDDWWKIGPKTAISST